MNGHGGKTQSFIKTAGYRLLNVVVPGGQTLKTDVYVLPLSIGVVSNAPQL